MLARFALRSFRSLGLWFFDFRLVTEGAGVFGPPHIDFDFFAEGFDDGDWRGFDCFNDFGCFCCNFWNGWHFGWGRWYRHRHNGALYFFLLVAEAQAFQDFVKFFARATDQ